MLGCIHLDGFGSVSWFFSFFLFFFFFCFTVLVRQWMWFIRALLVLSTIRIVNYMITWAGIRRLRVSMLLALFRLLLETQLASGRSCHPTVLFSCLRGS